MLVEQITEPRVGQVSTRYQVPRTLAGVRDILLAGPDAASSEVKLQLSAINTVARASGCAPDDLSADPPRLREHLAAISPAMAGLTLSSWSSVRSRLLKALQRVEVSVMSGRRTKPLSDEWAQPYRDLPQNSGRATLGRLIGYLSDHQISPKNVSDSVIQAFKAELEASSMRGRPSTLVRSAVRGWNTAVKQVPNWPQQQLKAIDIARVGYVLAAEAFSASFRASLTDYIAFLTDPPEDDDAPLAGLRPTTLKLREFQFRQMASALVHRGVPVAEITGVTMLARPDSVDRICEFFIDRRGRPDYSQLGGFLAVLRPLAAYHLKDRALAAWIGRRLRRLSGGRTRRVGMTEKNRRRLALFRDPQQVRDLLLLPYRLLKRAESGMLPPREAAMLVRAAVAIELEIMCPIRLQNLSEINIDIDLVRSRPGRKATVHLFIPGKRTKNGEDIELELPGPAVGLIDLYVAKYRNLLIEPEHRGNGPRFLFPRPDGTVKGGKVLAQAICDVMLRELGAKFNIHLFRHLGCFLYLRSYPGQLDVMRRVLGHRDGETTRRFYAFVEQSDAFRQFDAHVLRIRDEALRPRRGSIKVRQGQHQ